MRDQSGPMHKISDAFAITDASDYTDQTSGNADHNGFDEKLHQYIDVSFAQGHPHTNSLGAFQYRNIHDVHNPNAAHNQRYPRNNGE